MDRITAILRLQWRSYWRSIRRAGHFSRNNAGLLLLIVGLGAFRYLQELPPVATQLQSGRTSRYEMLLGVLFLVWLLPVMAESRRSISTGSLLHFPLSPLQLYCIRVSSIFISPLSWIVGLLSIALCYATIKAVNPVTGSFGLLLFVIFAVSISLAVTHLLSNGAVRRFLFVATLGACAAIGVYWLAKEGSLGQLPTLRSQWLPNKLAGRASVGAEPTLSLAILLVLTLLAGVSSFFAFRVGLQSEQNLRPNRLNILSFINFPGKFGGLLKKDLRYASRLLDLYLAVPVIILSNIYLISNNAPSPGVFWTLVNLLLLPCVSLAFNGFGLDSARGLDRYSLLPLTGREVILSKNLSFGVVTILLFSMILPVAFWRLGIGVVAGGFVILVLAVLAYLVWGNWMSVHDPFKVQFYRFSSGGSPVDAVGGVIFGGLPGIVAISFLNENLGGLWKLAGMLALYVVLYLLSLRWTANMLETRRETVRLRLS